VEESGGYKLLCWFCTGSGKISKGEGCQKCKGFGTIEHKERLGDLINTEARLYFNLYTYIKSHKLWPVDGGLYRQNSKLIKVHDYCERILAKLDDIMREHEKTNAALKAKQKNG
jgi:hypothetical protein